MESHYEFEKPIANLEKQIEELKSQAKNSGTDFDSEIKSLEKKLETVIHDVFQKLSPWERVQLSRHPNRPYTLDYIENVFPDFKELHGDRTYGDDPALVCGVATFSEQPILIIGHQKGRGTKQKMIRNFGMARPEGYRKAMRLMKMAERFHWPILTLIDTPGAYPGIDAEERGQSQAIAESILMMFGLKTPICSVVIGEGGSGGALAIGIGDRVLIQENGTYSVISPESCASILWSDSSFFEKASDGLKLTSKDLMKLEIVDGVISEPIGGAHRDWNKTFKLFEKALMKEFEPLIKKRGEKDLEKLLKKRSEKFRKMGHLALAEAPEADT